MTVSAASCIVACVFSVVRYRQCRR